MLQKSLNSKQSLSPSITSVTLITFFVVLSCLLTKIVLKFVPTFSTMHTDSEITFKTGCLIYFLNQTFVDIELATWKMKIKVNQKSVVRKTNHSTKEIEAKRLIRSFLVKQDQMVSNPLLYYNCLLANKTLTVRYIIC